MTASVRVRLQLRLFENLGKSVRPPSIEGRNSAMDKVDAMTIKNFGQAQTTESLTAATGVWIATCLVQSLSRLKTIAGIRLEV